MNELLKTVFGWLLIIISFLVFIYSIRLIKTLEDLKFLYIGMIIILCSMWGIVLLPLEVKK